MARPRSTERRNAILSAATRVIAAQGIGAATAAIAKEAGVSNGSLFLYFDTKVTLLNALYTELKTEMGTTALAGLPDTEPREQLRHMWTQWLHWATANPEKRRALAQLTVAEEITSESHHAVREAQRGMAEVLERGRVDGPMRDAPLGFVLTLANAIAEATIDAMIREPAEAGSHSRLAFEAVWRVLAGTTVPAGTDRTPGRSSHE